MSTAMVLLITFSVIFGGMFTVGGTIVLLDDAKWNWSEKNYARLALATPLIPIFGIVYGFYLAGCKIRNLWKVAFPKEIKPKKKQTPQPKKNHSSEHRKKDQ